MTRHTNRSAARRRPRRGLLLALAVPLALAAGSCAESASAAGDAGPPPSVRIANHSTVPIFAAFARFDRRPDGLRGLSPREVRPKGEVVLTLPDPGWVVLAQSAEASRSWAWQRRVRSSAERIEVKVDPKSGRIEARVQH